MSQCIIAFPAGLSHCELTPHILVVGCRRGAAGILRARPEWSTRMSAAGQRTALTELGSIVIGPAEDA
jgi:hypothetical protein